MNNLISAFSSLSQSPFVKTTVGFIKQHPYVCALAAIGTVAGGVVYLGSTRNAVIPNLQIDMNITAQQDAATHLIRFYAALVISSKPLLFGDNLNQATQIRTWMNVGGAGHAAILKCTTLNLEGKFLVKLPPEICLFRNLEWLNLSNNQLAAIPAEIGNFRELRDLNLSNNQLAAIPAEIGNLRVLGSLNLSNNQLAAIPAAIGNLRVLRRLDLGRNQLAVIPAGIGNLGHLDNLFLNDNRLISMPDSILNLSGLCVVHAEQNLFSPQYAQQFQQGLLAHRTNNPNQGPTVQISLRDDINVDQMETLNTRLEIWAREFEATFPPNEENREYWENRTTDFTPLTSLTGDDADNLNQYLRRIRNIKDYAGVNSTQEARKNVVLRTDRMIQLACKNPVFRENMLALIAEGLESCGDRVLIIFNEIEIQWQFHHKELTEEQFKSLALGAVRYDLVKKHAEKVANERGWGDKIEAILRYHIELREKLNLPITTQGMLYPGMAQVTEEMIDEANGIVQSYCYEDDLLAKSSHWQERQKKQRPQSEIAEINEKFYELLERAEDYFNLSSDEQSKLLLERPDLHTIIAKVQDYNGATQAIQTAWNQALARSGSTERKDPF